MGLELSRAVMSYHYSARHHYSTSFLAMIYEMWTTECWTENARTDVVTVKLLKCYGLE
jgi:hypothetical protein